MWPPLWPILVYKILNFGQKLPIKTDHHTFLKSKHPEVTKNPYYVLSFKGSQKKVWAHGIYVFSAVIIWVNLNKTAVQAFWQFSVSFMCLETYTKNTLLSNLRNCFFGLNVKAYVIWVIWDNIFYLEEEGQNDLPVTSELHP